MRDKSNHESLMKPFKPPRKKIDRPIPSNSNRHQRLISKKKRRRTNSNDSDSPNSSYATNSTHSDSNEEEEEEEDEDLDLPPPTYPLTPPNSSPTLLLLLNRPEHPDTLSDDSDSDSLLRPSVYDLLLARVRERKRCAKVEKGRGVYEGVGEVKVSKKERKYVRERVEKRPFIAPAVALKEEEEEEEEDSVVGGLGMKIKTKPVSDSEVEIVMEREGNDSNSSGELRAKKKREVLVGEAYKRPRRVEISEMVMDRKERSNRIIKHKDDSSYALPDEERLDSQDSQEDWLPSPEQVFGIGRGYSKSTSDSEAS